MTNFIVFILAIICLTSSLPIDEEINEASASTLPTVVVKKSEEQTLNSTKNTLKDDLILNESKTTPKEDNKNEIKDVQEEIKEEASQKGNEENSPVEITETFIPVTTNGSKDVYVIKTIVYEVGILTEVDNSTLNDTESHEEVNLTFFDPKRNESIIDLSNIPVPIQTNISGVSVTGLAPANFGTIQLPEGDKPATLTPNFPIPVALLPSAVISVKHNISTTNVDKEAELLSTLPNLLGLTSPITGEQLKIETSTVTKVEGRQDSDEKESSEESDSSEESKENSKESDKS